MEIKLTEGKKELFAVTHPFFKGEGYRFQSKRPVLYRKEFENFYVQLYLQFAIKLCNHLSGPFRISFKEVEKIILEIGIPTNSFEHIKKGDNILLTIHDIHAKDYMDAITKLNFKKLDSFRQWGHAIVDYAQGPGKAFINTYSYLPNVLKELDRLEAEGKNTNEILVGLADRRFRGLIISKLCSDPNFEEKVASSDEVFYKVPQLKDWIPYYNKLKERLKTIEPLYPYYKNV